MTEAINSISSNSGNKDIGNNWVKSMKEDAYILITNILSVYGHIMSPIFSLDWKLP